MNKKYTKQDFIRDLKDAGYNVDRYLNRGITNAYDLNRTGGIPESIRKRKLRKSLINKIKESSRVSRYKITNAYDLERVGGINRDLIGDD